MGIDGIGKGGPPTAPDPPGLGEASPLEKKGPVEKAFSTTIGETQAAQEVRAAHAAAGPSASGTSPLARFRAGEIDVNGYVDLKVEEVLDQAKGLSPAEIDDIRKMLRDQIATDPGLSDLVRVATGQAPKTPED